MSIVIALLIVFFCRTGNKHPSAIQY